MKQKVLNFYDILHVHPLAQRILKYIKAGKVLDLGSGSGRYALFLAKKGFQVMAVDSSKDGLDELKRLAKENNLRVRTKQSTLVAYRPSGNYDLVLALMSLHFLGSQSQCAKVVRMMKLHTKKSGINIVSVHTKKNPRNSRPHLFRKNELKKLYSDWKVLEYEEGWGSPFRVVPRGEILRKHRALIIAQKI